MKTRAIPAGGAIFRIGEASDTVYVIEDGEVVISVADDIEVARLGPGDLFGESGVLESRPRSANATAAIPTRLLLTDGETFAKAFGMDNQRALSLVKLLCARLRNTTRKAAALEIAQGADAEEAAIHLLPDDDRLTTEYGMKPVDVIHLPFQVGNRFGGETIPIGSNRSCCIPAHGDTDLAAPHFEILRRDGKLGIRDLGTYNGTIVNGTPITRGSMTSFLPLHVGDNTVIAGRSSAPFRFRIHIRSAAP